MFEIRMYNVKKYTYIHLLTIVFKLSVDLPIVGNSDNKSSNRCTLGLPNDTCCEADRWTDNVQCTLHSRVLIMASFLSSINLIVKRGNWSDKF